jgi:hypothetical protein
MYLQYNHHKVSLWLSRQGVKNSTYLSRNHLKRGLSVEFHSVPCSIKNRTLQDARRTRFDKTFAVHDPRNIPRSTSVGVTARRASFNHEGGARVFVQMPVVHRFAQQLEQLNDGAADLQRVLRANWHPIRTSTPLHAGAKPGLRPATGSASRCLARVLAFAVEFYTAAAKRPYS